MSDTSDIIDHASNIAAADLERRIAAARREANKPVSQIHSEDCANDCGERRAPPSRYCSPDCRDEADRREGIRRRQGIKG